MEDSIFTKMIKGQIPYHKIYEDDNVLAFLTINPVADGHTLVVPKKQIDQLWDLSDEDYQTLLMATRKIALHLRQVTGAERIGVVVKGFEVPHIHIHLIPVSPDSHVDFDPDPSPPQADDSALAAIAERLKLN